MSRTVKIVIGVYIFGCLLIFFGAPHTFLNFCATYQWEYMPETSIFRSLLNASAELIRPFLAVVICGWAIFIPLAIPLALWSYGTDISSFFRDRKNRDDN